MFFRCTKLVAIIILTPLLMATSCIYHGPYYSLEHEIECPPEEYHMPMYSEYKGYKLEMTNKHKSWCAGQPMFVMEGLDKSLFNSYPIIVYAKIIRNKNNCKLAVAVPTHAKGQEKNVDWKELYDNKHFMASKRATELFPRFTRLKTTGKATKVIDKNNKDNIRKWCGDI